MPRNCRAPGRVRRREMWAWLSDCVRKWRTRQIVSGPRGVAQFSWPVHSGWDTEDGLGTTHMPSRMGGAQQVGFERVAPYKVSRHRNSAKFSAIHRHRESGANRGLETLKPPSAQLADRLSSQETIDRRCSASRHSKPAPGSAAISGHHVVSIAFAAS